MSELIGVSKVILQNERGEVLLLLRGATAPSRALTWDLPGGIIEKDEGALAAAIRETKEETNLDISESKLKKISEYKDFNFFWTVYGIVVTKPEIKISWEHDEYKWVDASELAQIENIPEFLREIVTKSYALLETSSDSQ